MSKSRLEAFSDGVLAILITIMVLEMKVPHGEGWGSLKPLIPVFLSYVLSFLYLGIYWSNHHHLLQAAQHVKGRTLWANLHLLFWLSLIPFVTGWMGENHFGPLPVALYGIVLLLSGIAYYLLALDLVALHGKDSSLGRALGKDYKTKISMALYAVAIPVSFKFPLLSCLTYFAVALLWFIPDRRIEKKLHAP
ncbi:MAG: TMEM175 family protein [bacterium]